MSEEYAEGERSPKEFQQAVATLNTKMDEVRGQLAKLGVESRLDASAVELRANWDREDFPLARKRATVGAYIEEIRIHPASRPYSVFNPNRIEVIWR